MNNNVKFQCRRVVNFNTYYDKKLKKTLSLLSRGHQFVSHKSQGCWKLTWSLTSELVGLVEVRAN